MSGRLNEARPAAAWVAARAEPWRHNPSQWPERLLIASLACLAAVTAGYMGLFQWGLLDAVWDPFFGAQSEQVLTSEVSHQLHRWFRVPDAIMGSAAYLADAMLALAGSTRRWQFRPWLVGLFGVAVLPLGGVSIALVVMQGLIVQAWCFLCLVTAGLSLLLAVLAVDEVFSSGLYLRRIWRETGDTKIVWDAFWGRPSSAAYQIGAAMAARTS